MELLVAAKIINTVIISGCRAAAGKACGKDRDVPIDHSHERNFRVLCPCVRRKFVDWDVPAAMLGLLGVA